MTNPTQSKPMTRQQVADTLGICTKTLKRFLEKEGIEIEPLTLLRLKLVELIIKKYNREDGMSD
jgi:DNA-binding XRE family transcriptional regulator